MAKFLVGNIFLLFGSYEINRSVVNNFLAGTNPLFEVRIRVSSLTHFPNLLPSLPTLFFAVHNKISF